MNIYVVICITFLATVCVCGLIHHLVMLTKRIEQLEKDSLTAKGKLPRRVQDDLMDAIATLNYIQINREVEDVYTNQLRDQLSAIRDNKQSKDAGVKGD